MKFIFLFLSIAPFLVKCRDEPQFTISYKLYLSNNETSIFLTLLDYSDISLAWDLQSPARVSWNNYTPSTDANQKQIVIYTNNSVEPFLVPESQSIQVSSMMYKDTKRPDLVVLALSSYQLEYYSIISKEFIDQAMTVVINAEHASFYKNWTDESLANNKTI